MTFNRLGTEIVNLRPRTALPVVAAAVLALGGGFTPPAPASAAEPGSLADQVSQVRATVHRGLRTPYRGKVAVENSVRACANAVNTGADACEIDVRLTRNGVPVLMHDARTGRTTRGRYCNIYVAAVTYQRIKRCRLNNGDVVPRLTDLARAMRPYAARKSLVVELKGRAFTGTELARVNRYLRIYGFSGERGNLVYQSYVRANVAGLKRISPRAPGLLISNGAPRPEQVAGADRLDGVVLRYPALVQALADDPAYVQGFQDRGLRVMAWQVNSAAALRYAVEQGVAGFLTDSRPTLLAAVQLRRGG